MPGAPTPWQQGFGPGTSHAGLPAQGGYGSNSSSASELKPIDYNSMMQKRSNVLIGTLLVEAGLVTDPTLNAALKIQELVREDRMDQEQAFDALKRLHSMGSSIDDYLSASDFKAGRATNKPRTATVGSPQQTAARAPIDPERARDLHAAIDLLLKAGILNEADLPTQFGPSTAAISLKFSDRQGNWMPLHSMRRWFALKWSILER